MSAPTTAKPTQERIFFAWMSLAVVALAVAGFLRSYLLVPFIGMPTGALPATALVHFHAALSFAWCALLLAQSILVVAGHVPLHRRLGWLGLTLLVGLVVTGPLVAVRSVARAGSPPEELAFLAVSLGNVLAYTALFGAAFFLRRSPAAHKRLMMVGMVVMLSAPFGRLIDLPYQLPHVLGPSVVVLALLAWDRHAYGSVHPISKFLGPAVLVWELVPNLYMNSPWWLAFARLLVGVAA